MSNSAVLILMPVLNEAKTLDRLISIIRGQTHRNFSLFIQDNKSQDETLVIARHHESQDNRIQVFSNVVQITGGENWLSMITKVQHLDKYDYCCFQAGDDTWGDENYLSNLVNVLDGNPNAGAANPVFKIMSPMHEVLKTIEIGVVSKFAFLRVWELCRNWDNVHHIYSLYRRDIFEYLINCKVSRFTDYSGSDWWWTYEFLNRNQSITCKDSIYFKLLEQAEGSTFIHIKRARVLSYFHTLFNTCKSEAIHLSRARQVRSKFHLIAIPLFYFIFTIFSRVGVLHYGIIRTRLISKRKLQS